MATPPAAWTNDPVKFVFTDDLDKLIAVFEELSDSISGILNPLSSGLSAAKLFLIDEVNPLLLAINFVLDQMLVVISNLKNSGVHFIVMYPSKENHSKWRSDKTSAILLRDVIAGYSPFDPSSFYLLTRDDIFNKYVKSFDDIEDARRPPGPGVKQITTIDTLGLKAKDFAPPKGITTSRWFNLHSANSASTVPGTPGVDDQGNTIDSNSVTYHVWFNVDNKKSQDPEPKGSAGGIEISLNASNVNPQHVISTLRNAINLKIDFDAFDEESGLIIVTNTSFGPSQISTDGVSTGLQFGVRTNGVQGLEDNATSGAIVIFAGGMTADVLKQGTYIEDVINTFCDLSDMFLSLIDYDSLREWHEECTELAGKINKAKLAARRGGVVQPVALKNQPEGKNWSAIKLTEAIPPMGTLLTKIEGILLGLKNASTGASSALANLIKYIDNKIAEIEAINQEISDFIQFLDDLNEKLNKLGTFKLSTLIVDSQPGGVAEIKRAILDDSIPGRPSQDLFYCSLISIVGTGTAFSFFAFMLGLSNTFVTGADETAFDEDELKTRFELE